MRRTRVEMIKALRHIFGQSEQTEQVIDWVQDAWNTYDVLSRLLGRSHTCQIMDATDEEDAWIELQEGILHEHIFEYIDGCMMN